jgi:Transglutaminase-like superfamily
LKAIIGSLALAALLAVVAFVPAAEAHTRAPAAGASTTQRLRLELRKSRAMLAHTVADLRSTRKKLASSLSQAQALEAQLSQLQGTLTQTTTTLEKTQAQLQQTQKQLADSQAAAASLRAKLDAIPTPLAAAEEQVRRDVAYEEQNGLPYSEGRLVAQAAMDYVVGHVSAASYGYLTIEGLPLPSSTPDSVLGAQAGICGHAALTFAAIVKHFGYQVRSVQFYYDDPPSYDQPDSHIADEVFYEGAWHFFDPTFGVVWVDQDTHGVLSITDARSGLGTESKDAAAFTNLAEDYFYGNGTAFETDAATTVVLDGQQFTN